MISASGCCCVCSFFCSSVDRTCDLLQQNMAKVMGGHCVITPRYIRLRLSRPELEALARSWWIKWLPWESHLAGNFVAWRRWAQSPEDSQQNARALGPTAKSKWILPTTWTSLEMDSSQVKPSDKNTAQMTIWIAAFRGPKQRTPLSHTRIPDPQKLWGKKCGLF